MNIENLVKGLQIIVEEVSEGKFTVMEVPTVKIDANLKDLLAEPEEKAVEEVVEPTPVEENEVEEEDVFAKKADELKDKSVAELRNIAREMGLPIRGNKSAILGRIVEALVEQEEEVEKVEEPVEEEPEVTEEVVEETEDVEEVEEEDEEPADENEELQAKLEQLDVEDLADLCNELEIPAKGKKQGLIARLMKAHMDGEVDLSDLEFEEAEEEEDIDEDEGIDVKEVLGEQPLKVLKAIAKECNIKLALKDKKDVVVEKLMGADEDALASALVEAGIIELDDEEEPEPVENEVEESEEVEEVTFEGSEERQEKCIEIFNETAEAIDTGDIEESDIKEFFEERFKGNKSELKKIENMDFGALANMYCSIVANLVDDDGEEVELEEPYMVGDTPYCCGVPMKKLDETTYLCEIDGEEVELED